MPEPSGSPAPSHIGESVTGGNSVRSRVSMDGSRISVTDTDANVLPTAGGAEKADRAAGQNTSVRSGAAEKGERTRLGRPTSIITSLRKDFVPASTYNEKEVTSPQRRPWSPRDLSPGSVRSPASDPNSGGVPRIWVSSKTNKKAVAEIQAPSTIADFYDFGTIVGQGGFGQVSEVLHAKTLQPFAGKVVPREDFKEAQCGEDGMVEIMELLMNTSHARLCKILHIFVDGDYYYFIMSLMTGGTLGQFIRRNGDNIAHSVLQECAMQVLHGVHSLHGLRLVHRDLKPDNVMLRDDGGGDFSRLQLCIVDYDMCSFLDDTGIFQSVHLEGTPGFLAPEVLKSYRYSVRSDLFSVGIINYFLLFRVTPLLGVSLSEDSLDSILAQMERWLDAARGKCADCLCRLATKSPPTKLLGSSDRPGSRPSSPFASTGNLIMAGKPPTMGGPGSTSSGSNGSGGARSTTSVGVITDSAWIYKVILSCLESNPEARPESASKPLQMAGQFRRSSKNDHSGDRSSRLSAPEIANGGTGLRGSAVSFSSTVSPDGSPPRSKSPSDMEPRTPGTIAASSPHRLSQGGQGIGRARCSSVRELSLTSPALDSKDGKWGPVQRRLTVPCRGADDTPTPTSVAPRQTRATKITDLLRLPRSNSTSIVNKKKADPDGG